METACEFCKVSPMRGKINHLWTCPKSERAKIWNVSWTAYAPGTRSIVLRGQDDIVKPEFGFIGIRDISLKNPKLRDVDVTITKLELIENFERIVQTKERFQEHLTEVLKRSNREVKLSEEWQPEYPTLDDWLIINNGEFSVALFADGHFMLYAGVFDPGDRDTPPDYDVAEVGEFWNAREVAKAILMHDAENLIEAAGEEIMFREMNREHDEAFGKVPRISIAEDDVPF